MRLRHAARRQRPRVLRDAGDQERQCYRNVVKKATVPKLVNLDLYPMLFPNLALITHQSFHTQIHE